MRKAALTNRTAFGGLIALALLATLAVGCGSGDSTDIASVPQGEGTLVETPVASGGPAGNPSTATGGVFEFAAYDLDGVLRRSDEWVGRQPVVINFWGTWCPPCRRELPDLIRVYNEYRSRGIEMIGLAVRDTPERVRNFIRDRDMTWVMLMGDPDMIVRNRIPGVPTTVFLDREGREVGRFVGPRNYQQFKQAFELILQS